MNETVIWHRDSTIALLYEAQSRGYEVFYYPPENLLWCNNIVSAEMYKVALSDTGFIVQESVHKDLNELDIILLRQDPPFDMQYLTTTYLLEQCNAYVINDPRAVRNCPEKLFLQFSEFMPATLITRCIKEIRDFYYTHKNIVLKPLYSYGGRDVYLVQNKDNLEAIAQLLIDKYHAPIVIQKFCQGMHDRRVLLLDGEIIGVFRRVPAEHSITTNLATGGHAVQATLSEQAEEMCKTIGEFLHTNNLIFAGIDLVDDYLLEINLTSPTGIRAVNKLYNVNLEKECWNKFEARYCMYKTKN